MKPLQFSQDKTELSFRTCKATYSTTHIFYTLQQIRQVHPITKKQINRSNITDQTSKLLAEYYTTLFSTHTLGSGIWTRCVNDTSDTSTQCLSNLEWLFPTAEPIHVLPDTNFILIPLPLPTYFQYVHEGLYGRVPFLIPYQPNSATTEWIRDIDYQEDNLLVQGSRGTDPSNFRKGYQHTDMLYKNRLIKEPMDMTSYIRVYKYTDISPLDAKYIFELNPSLSHSYSLADIPEYFTQHKCIERQFTFLEITSYNNLADTYNKSNLKHSSSYNKPVRLKTLSTHLEPLKLSTSNFIDIKEHPYMFEDIVRYFKKYNYMNQYSIPELKSGLRKLKKAIA